MNEVCTCSGSSCICISKQYYYYMNIYVCIVAFLSFFPARCGDATMHEWIFPSSTVAILPCRCQPLTTSPRVFQPVTRSQLIRADRGLRARSNKLIQISTTTTWNPIPMWIYYGDFFGVKLQRERHFSGAKILTVIPVTNLGRFAFLLIQWKLKVIGI